MIYNSLGDTEIKVSKICLGTMTFGQQNSEQEAHEQLDYAIDHGVNFIDTAELYAVPSRKENNGLTEKYIGTWFEKTKRRQDVVLATKITGPSDNLKYIRSDLRYTKEQIYKAIEGSLSRLKTDYIDLYQLHWPERKANFFGKLDYSHDPNDNWKDNFEEVIHILDALIKEGKIRHYGISNETPWGFMRHLETSRKLNLTKCVSIQNPYSLLNRSFEVGNAEIAIRENVGLLAYSPMAFGLLSGKYHTETARKDARLYQFKQMSRYNSKRSFDATAEYLKIAEAHDMSLATMALSFVNNRSFLTSNIIGATTMDQLKENIESIYVNLDEEILKAIDDIHSLNPNPAP